MRKCQAETQGQPVSAGPRGAFRHGVYRKRKSRGTAHLRPSIYSRISGWSRRRGRLLAGAAASAVGTFLAREPPHSEMHRIPSGTPVATRLSPEFPECTIIFGDKIESHSVLMLAATGPRSRISRLTSHVRFIKPALMALAAVSGGDPRSKPTIHGHIVEPLGPGSERWMKLTEHLNPSASSSAPTRGTRRRYRYRRSDTQTLRRYPHPESRIPAR